MSESEARPRAFSSREDLDFIRAIVAADLERGTHGGRVVTRFPPEPNGYLHIGHASSVCLNFGIAQETGGLCHLRFDDTNPETEDIHFVEAIIDDVKWLGFDWGDHLYFASDYFERMYLFAEHLISEGKAYVESLDDEEIRQYRGTVTEPGRPSPYRDRSIEENLDLFRRMRAGDFPDGAHVLRAKLDLASPNMRMRDPVLYRIRHARHYRTGDTWCIYPLYDFAHPIEDAIESVTHSICTLEFENNRPVYDWIVENLPRGDSPPAIPPDSRPRQYEFARRNLEHTVTSKRKLLQLVEQGYVSGWDDPRMTTIAGLRRRGVTPESIRAYAELVGVGKMENRTDIGKLEFAVRDDLNQRAPRVLCVLRPLRVVLTNYPEGQVEALDAPYFPHDIPIEGSRKLPFSRILYIDRDDFMEDPPASFRRLAPGREVRLRYGYVIRCHEVVRDDAGEIVELRCTYDEETRGGATPDGRKIRGTIHWVDAAQSIACQVRLYDRLFTVSEPNDAEGDFKDYLNPESLVSVEGARIEPSVLRDPAETRYQFERLGFFWRDPMDSREDALVFNRIVTLRDARVGAAAQATADRAPAAPATATSRKRGEPKARAEDRKTSGPDAAAPVEPPRSAALQARRQRYVADLGVGDTEAEIITREQDSADFFEAGLTGEAPPRAVANWVVHELPRDMGDRELQDLPFDAPRFARVVSLVDGGVISGSAGREVLTEMIASGGDPDEIVERLGLRQISDTATLENLVAGVVEQNPAKAAEYRNGRSGLLGFFVGQVMRRTEGRANPEIVKRLLESHLEGDA
ncbi:MAG: glutamine--tRNA ligase/YqeY domain fusion protein [Gemmatimonadota bacterium]